MFFGEKNVEYYVYHLDDQKKENLVIKTTWLLYNISKNFLDRLLFYVQKVVF